jgi:hypothetical protein
MHTPFQIIFHHPFFQIIYGVIEIGRGKMLCSGGVDLDSNLLAHFAPYTLKDRLTWFQMPTRTVPHSTSKQARPPPEKYLSFVTDSFEEVAHGCFLRDISFPEELSGVFSELSLANLYQFAN